MLTIPHQLQWGCGIAGANIIQHLYTSNSPLHKSQTLAWSFGHGTGILLGINGGGGRSRRLFGGLDTRRLGLPFGQFRERVDRACWARRRLKGFVSSCPVCHL